MLLDHLPPNDALVFWSLGIVVCKHEGEDGDYEKNLEEVACASARNFLVVAIAGLSNGASYYMFCELVGKSH